MVCLRIYLLWGLFITSPLFTQANIEIDGEPKNDSASVEIFYKNLNNQFLLRLFTNYKANGVEIKGNDKVLRYRPNGTMSFGIGFNYKWLGLGISVGFPVSSKDKQKYGNTKRIDFQLGIYSKAIGADAYYQSYKGYYLANPNDFIEWNEDYLPQLPDMQVSTIGANLFYIFNNDKFSYRAAYVGNQIQKKSAGSAVSGIFFVQDEISSDNGFIPNEIVDSAWSEYDVKSFKALTIGVSAGYLHTFVLSKSGFYINLAGIPGIGYRKYRLTNISGKEESEELLALHLHLRAAIGYTRSNLFLVLMGAFNIRNYAYKSYSLGISTEQIRFTFGWRFETKASRLKRQFYE